jgi:N-acetylglucosamine kinase-like BadF-type ATPase
MYRIFDKQFLLLIKQSKMATEESKFYHLAGILVADGGATKTSWCFSGKGSSTERFSTGGINPFFSTTDDLIKEWKQSPVARLSDKVNRIFFYGAGIINEDKAQGIKKALEIFFPEAQAEVQGDLLAAARATLGNKSGIACILGTGSNSCQYDGAKITGHVPPLGFVLGDEGSGADLGKQLVACYLKKIMPQPLRVEFFQKYPLEYPEFLNRVYHHQNPNRFLAGFVPFLAENIGDEFCAKLVENAFDAFISRNVEQYSTARSQPICFVGSVAFHFQEQLKKVLLKRNLSPGIVLKEPLEKLVDYHLQFSNG